MSCWPGTRSKKGGPLSAIVINQHIVHYEVLGRGRPLIFLHGWVGSWRYWIPTMQHASTAFRAYALDLWGFGDTAKVAEQYSLESQVGLIDGFLEQMGIGRVALVGHGLGAVIGALYTLRNPGVVDRLMAVSYPLDETRINGRLKNSSPADLADWLLSKTPQAEPARTDAAKTDPQAITMSMQGLADPAVRGAGKQLEKAFLLVNGQNDPAVSAPDVEMLLSLPEQTHGVLFEQSGHFPMLDESTKFNRLLSDFLAIGPGESPRQLQLKEEWKRRVR
jgi:pimeloyl-ACP methyl ester carboxylesterase